MKNVTSMALAFASIGLNSANFKAAKAEKVSNYTAEQVSALVANYAEGMSIAQLAESMGKTTRSIIAKLSREGVYQKKDAVAKDGAKVQKKDAVAEAIGAVLKMDAGEIESLCKANKTALAKIFSALANSVPA